MRWLLLVSLCGALIYQGPPADTALINQGPTAGTVRDPLARGFLDPPAEVRMRMFWRIFGPAWEPAEIDYQLGLLKEAGIGGVETFLFYPVEPDDSARGIVNRRLDSPEFRERLRHAARRAHEMGIRFTLTGGSGWPYGGPTVSPHDAAQRIRREMQKGPPYFLNFGPKNEVLVAAYLGDQRLEVKDNHHVMSPFGEEQRPLIQYFAGPTRMQVKRPALGGEGLVVDHYNHAASEKWLDAVVAPMLAAVEPGTIQGLFCDSLEVYNANWTHDAPAQFKRRRGYALLPHLNDLFDASRPASLDVRFDFWRTMAEIHEEEFTRSTGEWARKHGVKLEMEAYGTPPDPLTSARYIDVPTGEQYEWKGFSFSRFAASGAHLAGKRVIGAEAWTWAGIPNRLADTLSDLKLCSDYHFLAGENDLIGVDWAYSPRSVPFPGWTPYYGPVFNQHNPQWPYCKYLAAYINRCQWMLRQGRNIADVAIYLPVEDSFAHGPVEQMPLDFRVRDHFVTGEKTGEFSLANARKHHSDLIHALVTHGFNFDGIDFWSMARLARVEGGRLRAGDGDYRILILPNLEGIDLPALEKVARFCRAGGTVIATKRLPSRTYGGPHPENDRVQALIRELFGEADRSLVTTQAVGKGRAIFLPDEGPSLVAALRGLQPDMLVEPYHPEVTFVHRRNAGTDIYFICNVGEKPVEVTARLRREPAADLLDHQLPHNLTLLDPMTGGAIILRRPVKLSDADGYVSVQLHIPARGSRFVVLGGGDFFQEWHELNDAESTSLAIGAGGWKLRFDGPDAPAARELKELRSWTEWPDARFFAGQGIYTTSFNFASAVPAHAVLRLGELHEAAEVWVNGKVAGGAISPPFEVDVGRLLKPGRNDLEIRVGNLMVNGVLGRPQPDLRPLRAAYGNRFPDPEEKRLMKEPVPSGLLGPVTLLIPK